MPVNKRLLTKPYQKNDLTRALRKVLDVVDGSVSTQIYPPSWEQPISTVLTELKLGLEGERAYSMVHQEMPKLRPARRVLVIDDEASFCRFMSRLISGLGYEVTTTCQAKCAYLDVLTESDIVFIDMMMPEMDGVEVLDVLASHNTKSSIVLMSGADYSLAKAETMAKRSDLRLIGVLHKPFRTRDVCAILEAD